MSRRSWRRSWVLPLVVGALAFALGVWRLARGHPDEDAYILYRYAEHLAAGRGIVFNPGGPPAEGATDFLWLVLLAACTALGLNVALAAAALNAVGLAVIAAVIQRLAGPRAPRVALAAALVLPFHHVAAAGYAGFSTGAYCALFALQAAVVLDGRDRGWSALPWLGLATGLFRPDGVLAGVGFALVGFALARRAGRGRRYSLHALGAAAVGLAYFAWRARYFGEWLPLPLYVKSHAATRGTLPGLSEVAAWLTGSTTPLGMLLVLSALLASRRRAGEAVGRSLAVLAVGLAFLAQFLPAYPSQNIEDRFFAPVAVLVLVLLADAAGHAPERALRPRWRAVAALLVAAGLAPVWVWHTLADAIRPPITCMDEFGFTLGRRLGPDVRVALTEAGRLPYWSEAEVFDVVGLNTAYTAHRPADPEWLEEVDPDLVFLHHFWTLDDAVLAAGSQAPFVALDAGRLADAVHPELRVLLKQLPGSYSHSERPTITLAPLALERFLVEHPSYELRAVRSYGGAEYWHVYGFRPGRFDLAAIDEDLRASLSGTRRRSYLELVRLRR